jgi:glycopeptide antibiotics resistance protein
VQAKPDEAPDDAPSNALSDAPTWQTMSVLVKIATVVTWVVFVLYLVFLLKLLLFSRPLGSDHSVNLIPFATIANYLSGDAGVPRGIAVGNLLGNVVVFVPLGVFLPVLQRRGGIGSNLLIVVGASLGVELVQGVFGLGSADVDDLILNTLGGLLGILFFIALRRLVRRWGRVAVVIAALSLLSIPVLSLLVFGVRLRM